MAAWRQTGCADFLDVVRAGKIMGTEWNRNLYRIPMESPNASAPQGRQGFPRPSYYRRPRSSFKRANSACCCGCSHLCRRKIAYAIFVSSAPLRPCCIACYVCRTRRTNGARTATPRHGPMKRIQFMFVHTFTYSNVACRTGYE